MYPPVTEAVRGPPAPWGTSQAMVAGEGARLVLPLGHRVVVLLHRQGGPGRVQHLLAVLHLGVEGAEARLEVLDGGVVGVLGRLPLV